MTRGARRNLVLTLTFLLLAVLLPATLLLTAWRIRGPAAAVVASLGAFLTWRFWRWTAGGPPPLSEIQDRPLSPEEHASVVRRLKEIPDGLADLQYRLLERHGNYALPILLKGPIYKIEEFYPIGSIPKGVGCPWENLETSSIPDAVASVWGPLAVELPRTIASLKTFCRRMGAVRYDGLWHLLYVLPFALQSGDPYYTFLFGGPPNANPHLPRVLSNWGQEPPLMLRRLYAVHDGFGAIVHPASYTGHRVLSCAELLHPTAAEQGPDKLLEFFWGAWAGPGYFRRRNPGDDDAPMVFWNSAIGKLSSEADAFGLIDQVLIRLS